MITDIFGMRGTPYRVYHKHQRADGLRLSAMYEKLTQHQWPAGSQM